MLTPDSGLDSYRSKRLADARVSAEQLKQAREALDGIAFALGSVSSANWQRVAEAWNILRRNEPPRADPTKEETAAAAPKAGPAAPKAARADAVAAARARALPARPATPTPPPGAPAPVSVAPISSSPASHAPAAPARVAPPSPFAHVGTDVDATQGFDSSLLGGDVTPFQHGHGAMLPSTPSPNLAEEAGPSAGATEAIDLNDPELHKALGTMTLEQYASLSAEMAARPQQHKAILARYNVADDAMLMKLMAAWGKHFTANPGDREQWQAAVDRYREWLASESTKR